MKTLFMTVLAALVLALSVPDLADAARMGGGRSMGSKPFMSVPTTPRPQPAMPGGMQSRPMTNQSRPQAQAPAAGGMMGGMGGFFGGMLAGSLLGSMFGGHAAAGAAGEGGMGLLDMLLIGLLIYFGIKFFRSRMGARQQPADGPGSGYDNQYGQYQQPQGAQYSVTV